MEFKSNKKSRPPHRAVAIAIVFPVRRGVRRITIVLNLVLVARASGALAQRLHRALVFEIKTSRLALDPCRHSRRTIFQVVRIGLVAIGLRSSI